MAGYPSDLSMAQWKRISSLIPAAKPGGRPRQCSTLDLINAMFYVVRSGCAWRMLPRDFPAWQTVYYYFRRWQKDGTWQKLHDSLRRRIRVQAGHHREPSSGILDSQSVKTVEKGGYGGLMLEKR